MKRTCLGIWGGLLALTAGSAVAQVRTPRVPGIVPEARPPEITPDFPSPTDVLPIPEPQPALPRVPNLPGGEGVTVQRFQVVGNTVFSPRDFAALTDPYLGKTLSLAELQQVADAITQLYVNKGYITSGAFIPEQEIDEGVVKIQVLEGSLEAIEVTGLRRLSPSYVRDRIAVSTPQPLNINQLVDGLRLLQLDPLLASINAELEAGTRPGQNILRVVATEAKTFQLGIATNNNAVETVGTFQYVPFVTEANLSGRGDAISVSFQGTQGSNVENISYTVPINAHNGTLALSFQNSDSTVIQPPFDELDIKVNAWTLDFTYRQPVVRSATQELALGVTFTRSQSQSTVLGLPIPISAGANEAGQTRLSVLRFFQDYLRRGAQDVFSARSQFSLGLNLFDATVNPEPPDAQFFTWRGQGQYAYQLAPQTLFLVRGDVQVADRALPAVEQFSLGGQQSVRGYSQDFLITDNGALLSAEVRVPLWRSEDGQSVFQIVPFTDVGVGWNNFGFPDPMPNLIAGAGIGLNFELTERLSLRLDFGIPLVAVRTEDNTWQDNGIYFTVQFSPFRGW